VSDWIWLDSYSGPIANAIPGYRRALGCNFRVGRRSPRTSDCTDGFVDKD